MVARALVEVGVPSWALRTGIAFLRKAEWAAIFIKEIFLFKTYPEVGVVVDGGTRIGGVRGAVGMHDFAEDDIRILAAGVWVQSYWLQNAVRLVTLGLHG